MDRFENECGCNKPMVIKNSCDAHETCKCSKKEEDCGCTPTYVDEESIFFSGLCDGTNFDLTLGLWTELSINGAINVPCEKNLIEQIDSINAKIEIVSNKVIVTPGLPKDGKIMNYEGRNVTGRKLIIEGLVCLSVSYVSTEIDQSVNSFDGKVPFSAFIVIPGEIKGVDTLNIPFMVSSCIEEVCVKSICDRTVNVTSTFVLSAAPSIKPCDKKYFEGSGIDCGTNAALKDSECDDCNFAQQVISGVCPRKRLETLLDPRSSSVRYWTEISVPEVLTIPCVKPDIEQILSVNSKIEVMCQKVIETPIARGANLENLQLTGRKLIVEAILRQRITYVSKTECQSVHSAHFDVPISSYIMLPSGTPLTDKFKIFACIEDIFACVLNDRQVFKNTTLFIKAQPIKCI